MQILAKELKELSNFIPENNVHWTFFFFPSSFIIKIEDLVGILVLTQTCPNSQEGIE